MMINRANIDAGFGAGFAHGGTYGSFDGGGRGNGTRGFAFGGGTSGAATDLTYPDAHLHGTESSESPLCMFNPCTDNLRACAGYHFLLNQLT